MGAGVIEITLGIKVRRDCTFRARFRMLCRVGRV